MKLGIANKINLIFITIFVIFTWIISFYFFQHQTNTLNKELEERVSALINNLSLSCQYPVLIRDREALEKLVKDILLQKDVVFCRIEDKEGKLLFQAGVEKNETSVRRYTKPIIIKREIGAEEDALVLEMEELIEEEAGKVYLGVSLVRLKQKMDEVKKTIVKIVIIAVFLAIISNLLFLKFVLKHPLDKLFIGIREVGKGNLTYKVKVKSGDEIGKLAETFNKMTGDLMLAGKKLSESEERYRVFIENAHDMIQSVGADGRFLFVNKAWLETMGYSEEELSGLSVWDIIADEEKMSCQKKFMKVMAGDSISNIQTVFVAKDGRRIIVEGNASPRLIDNKVVATQGFFRDITQRIRAENEQKTSEQQLKASNQQLRASEQQLKASNQQLRANEEQLKKQMHDLEVFYKANIGREERILELKKEIKRFKKELEKK